MTIFNIPVSVVFSVALNVVMWIALALRDKQARDALFNWDYWFDACRQWEDYAHVIKAELNEALKYKPYRHRGKFVSPRDVERL